ncbi:MAG: ATP-NAD kinase family protein [Methanophagales archaeon]|nr:ATP-NAD kinase family protein [Methanophagales archaeon]
MKIGFLINPIAGLGGSVGLKGTDGLVEEAMRRGATPIAGERAKKCLQEMEIDDSSIILTCSGAMGEDAVLSNSQRYEVVYSFAGRSTSDDTKNACKRFLEEGIDLLLFCGGDGTARDVYGVVEKEIPMIGIPAGVKMHSAVFAISPKGAAKIVEHFVEGKAELRDAEIMDTDEDAYRRNELRMKVFGYAQTPYEPVLVQQGKSLFQSVSEERAKEEIARFACEFMLDDSLYILGAGTTIQKIAELFGLGEEKTLLGVDAVKNGKLVGKDLNEQELLQLLENEKEKKGNQGNQGNQAKILVSPIGAQGFVFGRGNQQISAKVIEKVGVENVIVLATPHKLSETPFLLVDTGSEELDELLSGYMSVISGYRMAQRKEVRRG